jgi:hypothetical protein
MCHYTQLTFPVPAVIVVTLNPPDGAGVLPVKPDPIVIVKVSGYFYFFVVIFHFILLSFVEVES